MYGNDTFSNVEKLVFEANVISPSINYNKMKFIWSIDYESPDATGTNARGIQQTLSLSPNDYSFITAYQNYLVIDPSKDYDSILQPNINYTVSVTSNMNNIVFNCARSIYEEFLCNDTGSLTAVVQMNEQPTGGDCNINYNLASEETTIYALETLVTVECHDWNDTDQPLTYSFALDDGMFD